MVRTIKFGNRLVGEGQPVYLVAEAGINHNGDVGLARQLIAAAHKVGADAVKFQSFETDRFICRSALSAPHVDRELGVDGTFYDLLKKLELPPDAYPELHAYAQQVGIPMASATTSAVASPIGWTCPSSRWRPWTWTTSTSSGTSRARNGRW